MGIEAFNAECRKSVFEYTDEWREYVTRQARWVDFEHDYKTLDLDYMESVMWAFQQLWREGPGLRGLPGPALLLERRDPAVQPRAADGRGRLPDAAGPRGHRRLPAGDRRDRLVWTTTPWTLPSNLLIMVGPDIEYVVVESDVTGTTERYVVGAARLAAYARELKNADSESVDDQVVQRLTGRDLLGRSYTPPFTYFAGPPAQPPGRRGRLRHHRGRHRAGAQRRRLR